MTATSEWAPTVDDVGALLRARTKDKNGNELGTFTEDTRPTGVQVEGIIERVVDDLADSVTLALPERLWGSARRVAIYGVACEIELGYFPEQVATNRSPYAQLLASFTERRNALLRAWAAETGGTSDGDAGTGSDAPAAPSGGFPAATVHYLDGGSARAPGAEWPVGAIPLRW